MDAQVRAFESVAAASLACEGATPGNATKQAKAVTPPRRTRNRRAVRPIKPPPVGSAPGQDLALDGKRNSFGPESEDAWLGPRFIMLVSLRRMHSSVSAAGRGCAAFVGLRRCFPSRVAPYNSTLFRARCKLESREVRRNSNIAQTVRPIQRGTSR